MESSIIEIQRIATESKELISTIIANYQVSVKETAELIANEILKEERKRMEKEIQQSNKVFLQNFNKTKHNALELLNSIRKQARSKVQLLIDQKNQEIANIIQPKEEDYQKEMEQTKKYLRKKTIQSLREKELENHLSKSSTRSEKLPGDTPMEAKETNNIICLGGELPKCQWCGISSYELLLCGGCQQVWYCNNTCQERDWNLHQLSCSAKTVAMEIDER